MTERDPIDIHVGGVLRRSRMERGLSMERLARQIGVSYQQLHKYETAANRISASMLHRMAISLDVAVGNFFPTSDDRHAAALSPGAENLQACHALGRIQDHQVRKRLRRLIDQLANPSD